MSVFRRSTNREIKRARQNLPRPSLRKIRPPKPGGVSIIIGLPADASGIAPTSTAQPSRVSPMTGFLRARQPHAMTATFPCSGFAPDSLILHAAKRTGHDAAYELFLFLLYRNTGKSQLQSTPERIVPGRRFALCLLTAILRGIRLLVALFQRVHIFNKAPRRRRQAVIRAFSPCRWPCAPPLVNGASCFEAWRSGL